MMNQQTTKEDLLSSIGKMPLSHAVIMKKLSQMSLNVDLPATDPIFSALAVADKRREDVVKSLAQVSNDFLDENNRALKENIALLDRVKTKEIYRDVERYKTDYDSIGSETQQLSTKQEDLAKQFKILLQSQLAALPELVQQYVERKATLHDVNNVVIEFIKQFQQFNSTIANLRREQNDIERTQNQLFDETFLQLGKQGLPGKQSVRREEREAYRRANPG